MKLIIDADSCPREIRRIIMKAGAGNSLETMFVANRRIPDLLPPATAVEVDGSTGAADRYILEQALPEDLVVTRDIPLAAELVRRGITVINDRGGKFTEETVGERLSIRNHMKNLREAGAVPPLEGKSFGSKEKKRFADTFNRELTRLRKKIKAIP